MVIIRLYADSHLTEERMQSLLNFAETQLGELTHGLLLDTTDSSGFDMGIRKPMLDWLSKHHEQVPRFAIVTTGTTVWTMLLSVMSPIIRVEMREFDNTRDAEKWLNRPL